MYRFPIFSSSLRGEEAWVSYSGLLLRKSFLSFLKTSLLVLWFLELSSPAFLQSVDILKQLPLANKYFNYFLVQLAPVPLMPFTSKPWRDPASFPIMSSLIHYKVNIYFFISKSNELLSVYLKFNLLMEIDVVDFHFFIVEAPASFVFWDTILSDYLASDHLSQSSPAIPKLYLSVFSSFLEYSLRCN